MNVTFTINLEPTENDVVWWAEAAILPGLSVAAPTLRELRVLIEEAVRLRIGEAEIGLELATDPPSNDAPLVTLKDARVDVSTGDVSQVRFLSMLTAA